MRRTTIAVVCLGLALVVSNLGWLAVVAYRTIDAGVSLTYCHASYDDARATAREALALLPVVVEPGATRERILEAAGGQSFEKEGFVWVGHLGLRFDSDGRLLEAVPSVEPL